MPDEPDYTTLPPIYYARAAKRAGLMIATGLFLALLSAAVLAFLLLAADAEDRDVVLLAVLAGATAAGVWGVVNGFGMLRRNRAGGE